MKQEQVTSARSRPDAPAGWPSWAGVVQFTVTPADPAANLAAVRRGLAELPTTGSGLVALPELWGGGFAYASLAGQAEATPELLAALSSEARRRRLHLAGSLPEAAEAAGRRVYYNTLYLVGPHGVVGSYRKQRLFGPMDEPAHFQSAAAPPRPIPAPWGALAGLVCFDLRFPALATAQVAAGAEILLVAAQWPLARGEHWQVLLQARAIENQVFVVAANTCGRIGSTDFAGASMIIAPDGEILARAGERPQNLSHPLDYGGIPRARQLFRTVATGPVPSLPGSPACD